MLDRGRSSSQGVSSSSSFIVTTVSYWWPTSLRLMTGVWLLHDDVYSSASIHSFNYIQISIPTFLNNEGHYMHI